MAENSETRSVFITGLRNAHAMENQALSIMKPQVSRIENYPSRNASSSISARQKAKSCDLKRS